jgi:serine protease AprX
LVSTIAAHIQASASKEISPLMAKTLVIHSAALSTPDLTEIDRDYRGYGVPQDASRILGCEPWQATLLFELELRAGVDLERSPFPIPLCLTSAERGFRGEMTITLAYQTPLDHTYGAEYCRSNIDVSLGTYPIGKDGARVQKRQINPFPRTRTPSGDEKTLVEHGFKWSPIKVYRRVIPNGVSGDLWRLTLAATDRSGASNLNIHTAVAITVADIDRQAPVFNDMVRAMNQHGWSTTDIELRSRIRMRA